MIPIWQATLTCAGLVLSFALLLRISFDLGCISRLSSEAKASDERRREYERLLAVLREDPEPQTAEYVLRRAAEMERS